MKFPYELSEQRLSILSKEDRELYDFEHSIYFSKALYEQNIKDYQESYQNRKAYYYNQLNEDAEYANLETAEKEQMADTLTKVEAAEILEMLAEVFNGIIPDDEISLVKEACMQNLIINDEPEMLTEEELLEAAGHDMTYWLQNMGWLGKLGGALFGGIFAGLMSLIMAGKDKAAQKLLERYMNKLVELTDDGRNKKHSFFSLFGAKRENTGDRSQACFRTIQENVERNRLTYGTIFCKAAGLLGDSPISDALSAGATNGGFYTEFNEKIASQIKDLSSSN